MKIALINPSFTYYGGIKGHGGSVIPLNLCYLAAYVKKGNEVRIFDAEVNGWGNIQTTLEIRMFKPDIIGITTNTPVFDSVIDLCRTLGNWLPSVPIVLGGSHVSALPQRSLEETKADWIVVGEGELAFSEIINRSGECSPIFQKELISNLDTLPFPARELVNHNLYSPPPTKTVSNEKQTLLASSRGCPFSCGFCASHTVWSNRIRVRSIPNVIEEINECIHNHNIHSFGFTDEYFTCDKNRVKEFCEVILDKDLRISWVCSSRAQGLGVVLLKLMKAAGCVEISFGIESGDEGILTNINKGLNLQEARCVVKRAQSVGITTHCSYMFGYIGETEDTIKKTIKFAKKLNSDYAAFFIASPLPGTKLWFNAKEREYLKKGTTWIDYSPLSNNEPVLELPTITGKDLKKWHRKAIRNYYFRWGYIWARLMRIRHWYEIRNIWEGLKLYLRIK